MPLIAIVLLVAAALGGGTAVVAQQSLPGDPLWGFKVHVNEGVAGALSTSDKSKADWDISAIQTRLSEAQVLEQKGSLDAQAQADISANFNEHAQGVTDAIAKLEASGNASDAADAAARFQAALAQFLAVEGSTTITHTQSKGEGEGPLGPTVRNALNVASHLSAEASAEADHESTTSDSSEKGDASTSVNASASTSLKVKPSVDVHGDNEENDDGAEDGIIHTGL